MTKVYLDPGHGGYDSGASGHGLREKDVVLKIARYTRDSLQNNYKGVSVRMSRNKDEFISLTGRTHDANRWGADVFVSIHNNSFNGSAYGYEDYIYQGGVSSKTHSLQSSLNNEIAPLFRNNRGKKRANFAVVRQSSMPAVLTENGFIDNKTDADYLSKERNLREIGQAHARGIAVFLGLAKGTSKPALSEGAGSPVSLGSSSSGKGDMNTNSLVDYLKSLNVNSSFNNRKKIAQQHGVRNYRGTASQNIQLLNILRGSSASVNSSSSSKKYPLPTGTYSRSAHGNRSLHSVKQIQRALNAANFKVGTVDGYYGKKTEDAVRRFQSVYLPYEIDGIFGSNTRKELDKEIN